MNDVEARLAEAGRLVPEGRVYCPACERSVKVEHVASHAMTDTHRYHAARKARLR